MKNCNIYTNKTQYRVQLKTNLGNIETVEPGQSIKAFEGDHFTKQKFVGITTWRKI